MSIFKYQAFDYKGKSVSGDFEAFSEAEVRDKLRAQGLLVHKIYRVDSTASFFSQINNLFAGGVTDKVLIQFTNQLSILLRSGVPLLEAMNLLMQQFDGYFKRIIGKIIEDLKEGVALADAMEKYPKVFSKVYVQLVRAGEASGSLEMVLDRMTSFLERNQQVSGAISKAMAKPLFMIIVIFLVVIAAVTFIIPAVGKTLGQLGKKLPGLTQFMLDLSDFVRGYGIYLIAGIIFLWSIFWWWKKSEKGELRWHYLLLKLPKVSTLTKNRAVVQFSQTLGMLLEAGVHLPFALDIVNKIVDNAILRQTLRVAREEIIKEGKIAKHLKNTNIFPPVSIYMIKTGEESGKLAEMLTRVGKDTEVELMEAVDGLVAAIDPILTIVVALVALVIVLSIFLPILEISDISGNV